MSFGVYNSQDAYNGCLSLFSQEEAAHRGMPNRIRISGDVCKTATGYEFNISRITTAKNTRPNRRLLNDDSLDEDHSEISAAYPRFDNTTDYIIPPTGFAKIILTADESLFPAQRQRYNVTLQVSSFDFSDLACWPPLVMVSHHRMSPAGQASETCSVSLGDSWTVCDTSSDIGSEAGGDWELIAMEAIGDELQQMNILSEANSMETVHVASTGAGPRPTTTLSNKRSYADIVKVDGPNKTAREIGFKATMYCANKRGDKWKPVFQVKKVSVMDRAGLYGSLVNAHEYYEGSDDGNEDYDGVGIYSSVKSFGADARGAMLIANEAYCRQKALGIISVGTRLKSVK